MRGAEEPSGGEPKGDPDPDPKKGDPEPDPDPDPDPEPEPGKDKTAEEYRKELRNYERNAKRASAKDKKEITALKDKLQKREDADKSEQQKAVDKAREEGKTEAQQAAEKERRQNRLEVAVTRLAAKGIKVGEGEDAKTVRFADPEDALVHLERAIATEEVDDPFDDQGKVKADALSEALTELLERKPHLQAKEEETPKPAGDADAGKGGDGAKALADMSPEEHYAQVRKGG
jgi:flagellar biosynthesis/type III secretory pathway protein FliH